MYYFNIALKKNSIHADLFPFTEGFSKDHTPLLPECIVAKNQFFQGLVPLQNTITQ